MAVLHDDSEPMVTPPAEDEPDYDGTEFKEGKVSFWDPTKGYGFVRVMTNKKEGAKRISIEVYVHKSVLKGRKLNEGERVRVTWNDEQHRSGRVVASAIEGFGVQEQASKTGWVSAWDCSKGYGFIRSEQGSDIFVHVKDIGENYMLKIGAKVYYDTIDKGHERGLDAINITGPAVVLKTDSLRCFFYDIGIEMDDDLYRTLKTENIATTDDLLRCTHRDLMDLGFGNDAAIRIMDTSHQLRNFPPPKPEPRRTNDLEDGEIRCRVVTYKPTQGWGMVSTRDLKKIYVPREALKGGSLKHGEMVIVKPKDSETEHVSGRPTAETVRGYGYVPIGKLTGDVSKWNSVGLYGFIKEHHTEEESFVSFVATPELALRIGTAVTYDRVDKGGAKTTAENIGGEGLCLASDLTNETLGGAYGDFFRNTQLNRWGGMPFVEGRGGKGRPY